MFPSAELLVIGALAPSFPDYRFVTTLPATLPAVCARITRISGAARSVVLDQSVIDIDVFTGDYGTSDLASREIQSAMLSIRGKPQLIGVIASVNVVNGPRRLPDPNPALFRFNATYELHAHA